MGYTTDFDGKITVDGMTEDLANYINKFASIRHMKRNPEKIKKIYPNWKDDCLNGELGDEGCFFVGDKGWGFDQDASVEEVNYPPKKCPGLWCQWVVNSDDNAEAENKEYCIEWDEGEKFYSYVEWMEFIIKYFLIPNNCVANGSILWQGEDIRDRGKIIVTNNVVKSVELE